MFSRVDLSIMEPVVEKFQPSANGYYKSGDCAKKIINKVLGCPLQKVNKKKEVKDCSLFLMALLSSKRLYLPAFAQFIRTHWATP